MTPERFMGRFDWLLWLKPPGSEVTPKRLRPYSELMNAQQAKPVLQARAA